MTTATQRVCLFCDHTKLTREHIWPNWIARLWASEKDWSPGRVNYESGEHYEWKAKSMEAVAKVVCKQCNEGWMHDLESRAAPILKPLILNTAKPHDLSVRDLSILAAWGTLRSMVFAATLPEPEARFHTRDEYRRFATSLVPPTKAYMWLATFPRGKPGAGHGVHTRIAKDGALAIAQVNCIIGQIAFQVMQWRSGRKPFSLPLSSGWHNATLQVWPLAGRTVSWPPPVLLDVELVNMLCGRFLPVPYRFVPIF